MPAYEQYLVRTPRGTVVTLLAYSVKGAKDKYLRDYSRKHKLKRGDQFRVRRRLDDDTAWTPYTVL